MQSGKGRTYRDYLGNPSEAALEQLLAIDQHGAVKKRPSFTGIVVSSETAWKAITCNVGLSRTHSPTRRN